MRPEAFDVILKKTLQDGQGSRADRKEIADALAAAKPDANTTALLLSRVFAIAKENAKDQADKDLIGWVEEAVKAFRSQEATAPAAPTTPTGADAYFSPGDACVQKIISLIKSAQRSIDVCVFTITDDRIASALLEAYKRRVKIRIVTDNEKAYDEGSDALVLGKAGVPVRVDVSPFHMHHKFAIFDGTTLLSGSYNWTRGASVNNEENFVVTQETRLRDEFQREFENLWNKFAQSEIK